METLLLPHLPDHPLHICLFEQVQNASFLRRQLLEGNTDFEYAFLDASILLSKNHVLASCFRSINDLLNQRLKTRNVHSEIVFALSPNSNIAESFRRFGLSDDSKNIVAIKVGGDHAKVEEHLLANVDGKAVRLTDEALAGIHDTARIRKIYRLEAPRKGEGNALSKESEALLLGSMALKGS